MSISKLKILIIDDEEDICRLLSRRLERLNFEVTYAYTLSAGIQEAMLFLPDGVFLDLNLPDGAGFSIIGELKEIVPNCKIIISSAYDGSKERNRAGLEGTDKFIGKPLGKEKIESVLKELNLL